MDYDKCVKNLAVVVGGVLFGSAGLKLLSSRDTKKAYPCHSRRSADEGIGDGNRDHRTGERRRHTGLGQGPERRGNSACG